MSSTSKILTIIFSILLLGVLTFALCWGVINFKKVEEGLSGSSLYTEEDLEQSYQDGYNKALENEEAYLLIINEYKDTITKLNDTISQLNTTNDGYKKLISDQEKSIANLTQIKTENENSINLLNSTISENNKTIESLNAEKISLQTQVTNLTNEKTNNELTISSLNSQILSLQKQVDNLTISSEDKSEEILNLNFKINELQSQVTILANENADLDSQISSLNSQIKSLQSLNDRLQDTNESNLNTITTLNNQIKSLNSQIIELSNQLQNNTSNVTTLNNKIAELEKSISYYEQYIASLENGEQVVATFEFNGSVYNIQIINKNSNVSVVAPISTEYVIFNGWTVNGESVDLSTYQITANTKFVADITYKYDVKFMIDGELYNSQIVEKNKHVTLPDIPTKDGYDFDGWSLNGVDVVENISSTAVTQNVTYQAVFTKLHTVTFMYEEELKSTQQVRNGEYATNVEVENTTYKVFNGWKVNGSFVDIASYKINADTIFVADVTYKYDVKFKVDNIDYDSQVVIENGYATLPEEPTKNGYEFDGWSLNGINIVENISSTAVTQNITYQAVFTKLHTVSFMSNDKIISTQEVRNGEYASDVAISDTELQLFNGWKLNSIFVNLETHKIFMDTIFVADFIDKVGLFKNGEQVYTWEELIENGYINVTDLLIKPTEKTTSIDGDLYFPNEAFTIGNNAFKNCNLLTSVTFPENIYKIYTGSFYNCSRLEIINFNCIEAIIYRDALLFSRDYSIFEGCGVETNGFVFNIGKNVKSMYHPNSSITLIKDKSLIKEINLDKENINFIVENNCLIDVDKKALIMGLNVENITISNNVIIIADYAFYKCDKLKSVVISESVNYINSYAFGICSNLLSMEFLSSDMWIQKTSSTLYGEPFSVSDKYANVEKIGINSYDTKKVINQ